MNWAIPGTFVTATRLKSHFPKMILWWCANFIKRGTHQKHLTHKRSNVMIVLASKFRSLFSCCQAQKVLSISDTLFSDSKQSLQRHSPGQKKRGVVVVLAVVVGVIVFLLPGAELLQRFSCWYPLLVVAPLGQLYVLQHEELYHSDVDRVTDARVLVDQCHLLYTRFNHYISSSQQYRCNDFLKKYCLGY